VDVTSASFKKVLLDLAQIIFALIQACQSFLDDCWRKDLRFGG
jgi:hypothetical protein